MKNSIIVLDFGSQYSQLIARRLREAHIYSELFPWDAAKEKVMSINPKGFILSGGPESVYEQGAPQLPEYVLDSGLPILGICYGIQILAHTLGGVVSASSGREYGAAVIKTTQENQLLPAGEQTVWMSHSDKIEKLPSGFISLATSESSPIAAMGDLENNRYGLVFHPEVKHTPGGGEILKRFARDVCNMPTDWTAESVIDRSISQIKEQVKGGMVLAAVSGGVDSTVATTLVHKAVGDRLVAVFVDHGLLRKGEAQQVIETFQKNLGIELIVVDAADDFFNALSGVVDPEEKRKIIGERFIRVFEQKAKELGEPPFLVQGTIYPDVIESRGPESSKTHRIKSHHNVGGLPENMTFELVEPIRHLFKDEVRRVGEALELPAEMLWRQPFPGPGLAVRCLGEVTPKRVSQLQDADAIFTSELEKAGLMPLHEVGDNESAFPSQAFAVLLPIRSVGVMGDQRTYQETVAIRSVTTEDFMTADWTRLPYDVLAKVSNRIVNEVDGINRVVYDITSKPPATIEWE